MAQQLTVTTPELITKLYAAFGVTPPQGRALRQVVVVLEPGKPAIFDEHTFLMEEAPAVVAQADTKTHATTDAPPTNAQG